MPIKVTCTACQSNFRVSDKFAGRQGPCPKCKAVIQIPTVEEAAAAEQAEVVIHAPEEYGGAAAKDSKGRPVAKPIAREDTEFKLLPALAVFGAVLAVMGISWFLGRSMQGAPVLKMFISLLILGISGPLSVGGYWFLRNSELEPYSGTSLFIRAGIAAGIYCLLWIVLWQVNLQFPDLLEYGWNWMFVAPPLLAVGTVAATLSLDLEGLEGFLHCSLFVLVSVGMRWMAGMPPW